MGRIKCVYILKPQRLIDLELNNAFMVSGRPFNILILLSIVIEKSSIIQLKLILALFYNFS